MPAIAVAARRARASPHEQRRDDRSAGEAGYDEPSRFRELYGERDRDQDEHQSRYADDVDRREVDRNLAKLIAHDILLHLRNFRHSSRIQLTRDAITTTITSTITITDVGAIAYSAFGRVAPLSGAALFWRSAAAPSSPPRPIVSTALLGTIIIAPFSFSPS